MRNEVTVGVTLLQTSKHDRVQLISLAMQSYPIQPLFIDDCLCSHPFQLGDPMSLCNRPQYLEQT